MMCRHPSILDQNVVGRGSGRYERDRQTGRRAPQWWVQAIVGAVQGDDKDRTGDARPCSYSASAP